MKEYSREEILSMPVGRELDALVAEKVMGWKHYEYHSRPDDKPELFPLVTDGFPSTLLLWEKVDEDGRRWSPSTDLSAAFEALKATKRIVHIEGHYHTGWSVTLDGKISATEWDLPIAICKAALLEVLE